MEFPELGQPCLLCQRLDFLPFVCMHCRSVFCKEHLSTGSHSCPDFEENYRDEEEGKEKVIKVRCAFCKQKIVQELEVISCDKCNLKYCLSHRFPEGHDCPKLKEEKLQMQSKFKQTPADGEGVTKKMSHVPKVRGSKNDALASKVAIMQLKQKARGPAVPLEERVYAFVMIESTDKKEPFYFSQTWTMGRCVDFVTSKLKISNSNNRTSGSRIFLSSNESDEGFDYSMTMSEAVQQSLVADGDTLVLKRMETSTTT